MAGGLAALLDDIAALVKLTAASTDDIAAAAGRASVKAAGGGVIDDTAVVPQYMNGLDPQRELPIIKKIALGSLRNKLVFILPAILLLSLLLPAALTPLLMLGGLYLSYEGAEKVIEMITGAGHAEKEKPALEQGEDAEKQIISGAVRTDFILSAEIMVISLNAVAGDSTFWVRTASLVVVAVLITLLVYGTVALLVKMDDIGLSLAARRRSGAQKFGRALVKAMPRVMDFISVVGTFAMLWVGGHILLTGFDELGWHGPYAVAHTFEEWVHAIVHGWLGAVLAWCAETSVAMIFGMLIGSLAVGLVHLYTRWKAARGRTGR